MKNNMKTDAQVQHDVLAELMWEPSVNAAHIGADVTGGIVTLAGHVGSYSERCDAERAAQRVSGVKALTVEIDVTPAGPAARDDGDIARSAENVLQWTTYLPRHSVRVMVEGGWITLYGAVDWEHQKQAAARAVRYLVGVTGVSDQIVINAKLSLPVNSDTDGALKRRAKADAQENSVAVRAADITLKETVRSWSERALARRCAWGTAGVRTVVDKLSVAFSR